MQKVKVIPKAKRLKAYKYALTQLDTGMCISLADSVYGKEGIRSSGFYKDKCNWSCWPQSKEYFPELKGINCTKGVFTPEQRHKILAKAIKLCKPKRPNTTI